jgi:peptidoglycan/LPS O-acetylase OafA/YrhL
MSSIVIENGVKTNSRSKSDSGSFQSHSRHGYRPDIDGLRAIAVLSVVAFHFNIGPVPGGFIGVDIFFVISGFLITGNIVERLDAGTFSFLDFYQRRIRRIFPALIVVLLFTLALGSLALKDGDVFRVTTGSPFEQMFSSVGLGAAFLTNFALMQSVDYFTQTASTQPLLHLWSLAIEEQFYIIWPLLLYGIRFIKMRYLPFALAIAAISFGINIFTVYADPTTAFFSLFSRAWELMIGSALACLPWAQESRPGLPTSIRSGIGLALISVGLFAINWKTVFPGWAALMPTVGAALIISAGPNAVPNRKFLSTKPLVWIGLISYPLYLWHWPALRLFEQYSSYNSSGRPILKCIAVLGSILASWITFRAIEIPFRFGRWRSPLHAGALLSIMVAVGLTAEIAPSIVLYPASLTQYQRSTIALLKRSTEHDLATMFGERPCFRLFRRDTSALFIQNGCFELKYPGRKIVFLIGDSFSASLSLGVRPLLDRFHVNLVQVSTGWCKPTDNNFENPPTCRDINDMVSNRVSELKPDLLIIDSNWVQASLPPYFVGSDYFSHLVEKLADLERRGAKRIIVVGQIPMWPPSMPESLALTFVQKNEPIPQRTFLGVEADSLQMDARMKAIEYPPGVTYLSLKDALCDDGGCLTAIGPDVERDLVAWDFGHLTKTGSEFVTRALIEPALSDILEEKQSLYQCADQCDPNIGRASGP